MLEQGIIISGKFEGLSTNDLHESCLSNLFSPKSTLGTILATLPPFLDSRGQNAAWVRPHRAWSLRRRFYGLGGLETSRLLDILHL